MFKPEQAQFEEVMLAEEKRKRQEQANKELFESPVVTRKFVEEEKAYR